MKEYKIVVIGTGGVGIVFFSLLSPLFLHAFADGVSSFSPSLGKSALTIQFVQKHFFEEYDPTIEDSYRKQITLEDEVSILDILDTAGQEEYSATRDQLFKSGQGFLCVFAINNRQSLQDALALRDQVIRVKDCDDIPFLLVANKCDLSQERVFTREDLDKVAKACCCQLIETSAKNRENIDESFITLCKIIKDFNSKNGVWSKKTNTNPSKACFLL